MKHERDPIEMLEANKKRNRAKRSRQIIAGTRAAQELRNKKAKLKRKRRAEYVTP